MDETRLNWSGSFRTHLPSAAQEGKTLRGASQSRPTPNLTAQLRAVFLCSITAAARAELVTGKRFIVTNPSGSKSSLVP